VVVKPALFGIAIHPSSGKRSARDEPNAVALLESIEIACPEFYVLIGPLVNLGALMVGIQIRLDVGNVRTVKLNEAVSEEVHGAYEAWHLPGQELDEAVDGTLMEACRELHPGIRPERTAHQAHVDAIEPATVSKENVMDLGTSAELLE
jgi:hypothetical protein